MSPYPLIGQCTAFINKIIKESIGFKHVLEIKQTNNECKIITRDGRVFELTIKQID